MTVRDDGADERVVIPVVGVSTKFLLSRVLSLEAANFRQWAKH